MNQKPITRSLSQVFTWSFVISVGCFVGIIILGSTTPEHQGLAPAEAILLLLMVAAGLAWYITLGMIAHRLGRRWLIWTGLSFITAPIGPLVIYPLMLSYMKAAHVKQPDNISPPA